MLLLLLLLLSGPLLFLLDASVPVAMSALRRRWALEMFWSPREAGREAREAAGGISGVVNTSPSALVKMRSLRVVKYCLQASPRDPGTR